MMLKELVWLLGFKPKTRVYGYEIVDVQLPSQGPIRFAHWLHPKSGKYVPLEGEITELKKYIKPGDVCIDIGGYIGDTAIPMALAAGPEGTVFTIEPNPYIFETLKVNASLNPHLTNVIPLMFAATPEDGEMYFEYSDPGYCNGGFHEYIGKWRHGHAYKLKVQGKNLVDFLKKEYPLLIAKIRFIKIDAEGFDLSVLKSLRPLISLTHPCIRIEVFKKSDITYREQIFRFLKNFGYTLYKVKDTFNYTEELLTEDKLMNWKHYDIFAIPESRV